MTPLLGIRAYILTLLCCTVIILWIPGSGSPAPFSRMKMDKVDSNAILTSRINDLADKLGEILAESEAKVAIVKQQHRKIREQTKELKETLKQLIQQPANDFYDQMGNLYSIPGTTFYLPTISAVEGWRIFVGNDTTGFNTFSDSYPTR